MSKPCIFCEYMSKYPNLIIDKNDYFYIIPNAFPNTPRYMLIVTKEHCTKLNFCHNELISLQDAINSITCNDSILNWKKIYKEIIECDFGERSIENCRAVLNSKFIDHIPDGWNVGLNIGSAAGQTIAHFHAHALPRYIGDSTEPCGIGQIIK